MEDVDTAPPSTDAALLDAVRAGDLAAYGELFLRYAEPVRLAARQWTSQLTEQQDLVADAFARTLNAIRNGAGPQENPLPYLLTTVRRLGIMSSRRREQVSLYGMEPRPDATLGESVGAGVDEGALRRWHLQLARSAFQALPPRWRVVLWHTEVESRSPAELAPRLGLSPNGVAALAMRAREGLRQAYLQAQVPTARATTCVAAREHLGTWTRREMSPRRTRLIVEHLAACPDCRDTADMLAESNHELHGAARYRGRVTG
jgi:RNA polymerase sigma factor (sigma-70 family)